MMSKYVRTKDFIASIELEDENSYYCRIENNQHLNNLNLVKIFNASFSNGIVGNFYVITKNYIINQANAIKDLCDGFVITKNNEGIEFWKDFDALKQCSAHFVQNDFDDIYGAIWTKWGLRYVAKINNKEDLELI